MTMRMIDANKLKKYIDDQKGRPFIGVTIGEAFKIMVDEQPTIEERKTGKWEEKRVMSEAYDITGEKTWASVMRCDQCGFEMFAVEGHIAQYIFCPSCGVDMKGEADG